MEIQNFSFFDGAFCRFEYVRSVAFKGMEIEFKYLFAINFSHFGYASL